jgi:hypothetical protein
MNDNANGFGRLAKRIADWTTKALFSALVLVGGLGFGREVVRWWRGEEAPDASFLPGSEFGAGEGPVQIAFGDLPVGLGRQTLLGDQAEALKALENACREALPAARPWSPTPDKQELDLLDRLDTLGTAATRATLVAHGPPDARLHLPVAGVPLIVGTRRLASAGSTDEQNRVVLWGLAVPAGERQWTLWLFQAGRRENDARREPRIPLPADCRRLMALDQGDTEACAFQGAGSCDACRRFFTRWHAEQQPAEALRWSQTDGGGWYGVGGWRDAGQSSTRWLIIQLLPAKLGGCTGFLFSGER